MDFSASLLVISLCTAAGVLGMQFVRDFHERQLLVRLFLIAFALRVIFTVLCYKSGLVSLLGGADDTAWVAFWSRSRHWEAVGVDPIISLFNPDRVRANPGYAYFGSLFFYLLDMRSQMALACFNGFLNALTVVVIFKVARTFFSEKASTFAAWIAVFMPGFLIWSALTIKETWLILFEISTLAAILYFYRRRDAARLLAIPLTMVLVALSLTFRFYVAWFLVGGAIIMFVCYRSSRPLRTAVLGMAGVVVLFIALNALGIVRFDLLGVAQAQITELSGYRENLADPRFGGSSSVALPYDTTTPVGALKMLVVGGIYLLLSPFPWQMFSGRQIYALPDVLLWWFLVFGFILPGIRYAWNRQRALLMSLIAFVLPLFMFYSMMFGNIGLAYRQRAQLMPFLLVLVAAGYASREREEEEVDSRRKVLIARLLLLRLQGSSWATTRTPSSSTDSAVLPS